MALTITSQPQNTCIAPGSLAKFTIGVTGDIASYDWQYSTDKQTWVTLGYNNNELPINNAPVEQNRTFWRCLVTDSTDSSVLMSNTAILYVISASFLDKLIIGGDMFLYVMDNINKQTELRNMILTLNTSVATNTSDIASKEPSFRYTTMPSPSGYTGSPIIQYIGNTYTNTVEVNGEQVSTTYTQGKFYKYDSTNSKWIELKASDLCDMSDYIPANEITYTSTASSSDVSNALDNIESGIEDDFDTAFPNRS